jgi:hypothetical protein
MIIYDLEKSKGSEVMAFRFFKGKGEVRDQESGSRQGSMGSDYMTLVRKYKDEQNYTTDEAFLEVARRHPESHREYLSRTTSR